MSIQRKAFYVFDMAVVALLLFAINHVMIAENEVIDLMLDAALLFRLTIPFLLYRRDKMAFIPIALFVVLYGMVIYIGAFGNTIFRMSRFPYLLFDSGGSGMDMVLPRYTDGEFLVRAIIYWVWLIPVAVYIIQLACKQAMKINYPWYYYIGGIVFKDKAGGLFLSVAVLTAIAFVLGYGMQEYLSFYALIALPLAGYYLWNKHLGRKPYWLEYFTLFAGLYIFDKAQYKIDNERVAYLAASAVVILGVSVWMLYKSKDVVVSALTFLLIAFVLPMLSLGYNVYQGREGARSRKFPNVGLSNNASYMYVVRDEMRNGKQVRLMGVRDRYRTTIPCEYKFIFPTGLYSPFANCITEDRDSVVRSIEEGYILK